MFWRRHAERAHTHADVTRIGRATVPTKTMAGKEPTIFEQIRKEFGFMKNISSFNESNHIRSYVCSCRAQVNRMAASVQVS